MKGPARFPNLSIAAEPTECAEGATRLALPEHMTPRRATCVGFWRPPGTARDLLAFIC